MSYVLDPGFPRGHVLGVLWSHPTEKTDPITGTSTILTKKQFTDVNPKTGSVLSNEIVTCLAVKNPDPAATAPWAPGIAKAVAGYTGIVDEYLPKVTGTLGGCKPGEVCWLVIEGPYTDPADNKRKRINVVNSTSPTPITRLLPDGTEEEVELEVNPAPPADAAPTDDSTPAPAPPAPTTPTEVV
jgi:hypothetical protein